MKLISLIGACSKIIKEAILNKEFEKNSKITKHLTNTKIVAIIFLVLFKN